MGPTLRMLCLQSARSRSSSRPSSFLLAKQSTSYRRASPATVRRVISSV